MHYFGSHTKSKNLIKEAKKIKDVGGNLIQILLTKRTQQELEEFKEFIDQNNMKVVIHSSYTHNIALDWDEYSWWLRAIIMEIQSASFLGAMAIVIHFGKSLDITIEETYNNMYTSLIYIHEKTIKYKKVQILLETSSGQGTEACYKLEELAHFYRKLSKSVNNQIKNRFKLCVDTCHIFSAGYDIRNKENIKRYLEAFEEMIGINYIQLIHLNDCKVQIGERKDRHQNIGDGYIGLTGLKEFFKYFKQLNIPIVLETPDNGYKKEIPQLKIL